MYNLEGLHARTGQWVDLVDMSGQTYGGACSYLAALVSGDVSADKWTFHTSAAIKRSAFDAFRVVQGTADGHGVDGT